MTQKDRDRLVALQKARKGLITQKEAAEEIGRTERQVRRLLKKLRGKGEPSLCTDCEASDRTGRSTRR